MVKTVLAGLEYPHKYAIPQNRHFLGRGECRREGRRRENEDIRCIVVRLESAYL